MIAYDGSLAVETIDMILNPAQNMLIQFY